MENPFSAYPNDAVTPQSRKSDSVGDTCRRILAVGGGKGGVGKSVVSILLAAVYARQGRRVVLVDLDLGAANLHTYLGMHSDSPGMADFLTKKADGLDSLLTDTPIQGVRLISGARYYPGMANPAHQTKLKLIRHIRELSTEVVILDLGAGVHLNTLDFFSMCHPGVIVLAPEPGSVLNAYSFVKGAVYRHLSHVFSRHPGIREVLEDVRFQIGNESSFSIESFRAMVENVEPSLAPLVSEVIETFRPALIMNQAGSPVSSIYSDNLQRLVQRRLALRIEYLGSFPALEGLSRHLSGLHAFLKGRAAEPLLSSAEEAVRLIESRYPVTWTAPQEQVTPARRVKAEFSDEDLEVISEILDGLDEDRLKGAKKSVLRLRLFYKPSEVVTSLLEKGVSHPIFFESS